MNLDCNTTRGRIYINHQLECINILKEKWGVEIFSTNDDTIADADAIAIKNGKISAILEIKSRETNLEQLKKWGSYLITFEKILKLRNLCKSLCCVGVIAVYLLQDKKIVFWKICDANGEFLIELNGKITTTQKTCNGNTTDRFNAYLSLDKMNIL